VRTTRKKSSGNSKPEVQVLDVKELQEIIERAGSGPLSEADRSKLSETVDTLAWLQQELGDKDATLARLRGLFGLNTSEKTKDVLKGESGDEQSKPPKDEAASKESKKKPKGHGRKGADAYTGAERVKVSHESLKPGDPCPVCPPNKQGKVYMIRKPRTLVRVVGQAPLKATIYELETLRCNLCGEIFPAASPPGVGKEKYNATAAIMIALLKYGSGMPFDRLRRLQESFGIPLPAATQWDIVEAAAAQLIPVHAELIRQGAQGRLMHNDDTSVQVVALRKQIDEEQKSGTAESDRTGIFSTSIVCELSDRQRIALFFTGRQHAGENMTDLLANRAAELDKPMQMCDALAHNLPKEFETIVANCLAHARRKFVEVVNSFPDECRHVLETLRDVYAHDATTRKLGLSDEQRLCYHQEHSAPLMDGLEGWMKEQFKEKRVEPNSALGKAITYMTKRWDRFTLFLRVPGAPLDNNIAERALKKAILHRRNSLFYKTENGARVGDLFMSLIHTAELARANTFKYLTALIEHAAEVQRDPGKWMPWNYRSALELAEGADRGPTS
jgi:hypothetical protein